MTELTVITQEAELTQAGLNTEALLSLFIASLDIKKSYKESYRRALRPVIVYTEKKKLRLSELRREDIIEYKSSLFEAGLSALTVGAYINAVRLFFEYAEAQKVFPNIAKGIRAPKRLRRHNLQRREESPLSAWKGQRREGQFCNTHRTNI